MHEFLECLIGTTLLLVELISKVQSMTARNWINKTYFLHVKVENVFYVRRSIKGIIH